MRAPVPERPRPRHATTAASVPSTGDGAAVAASPDASPTGGRTSASRRPDDETAGAVATGARPLWRDVVPGVLLGLAAGALGTAVHLNLTPVGSALLPWGLVLALVLAGSTQRWWMRHVAQSGGRPVPAGGAVVLGAFTAAAALRWLPGTDRLDLPWTAEVAHALPVAFAASVGWVLGLPVLGVLLLALGARALGRRAPSPAGPDGESTLGGTPNPAAIREVDGQP